MQEGLIKVSHTKMFRENFVSEAAPTDAAKYMQTHYRIGYTV